MHYAFVRIILNMSAYWASYTCSLSITLFCPVAFSQPANMSQLIGIGFAFSIAYVCYCVAIVLHLLVHQRSLLSSNLSGLHRGSIFFRQKPNSLQYESPILAMQAENATQKQHHLLTAQKKPIEPIVELELYYV